MKSEWVIVVQHQFSNFSVISWREQVNFQWDDDKVRFVITVFTVFRLLTDFVCLYNYEFGLSLCKIVRSSVILLLPLFVLDQHAELDFNSASSLKQQSSGRHVAPLGHIILIPSQPVFALSP